jgi:hypothetical protein
VENFLNFQGVLKKAAGVVQFGLGQAKQAQQSIRQATSFLDPVERAVNSLMQAESRLPSGRVAQGAGIVAEKAGIPSIALPLLGVVGVGAGIRFRSTRVGKQFPEAAEAASQHMEGAYTYIKAKKSTDPTKPLLGYPNFVDPTGEQWVLRSKGQLKDGTPRVAFTPLKEKQASATKRTARDVPSGSKEKFERGQFLQAHQEGKTLLKENLVAREAGFEPYIEHGRRLNSPYWSSERAKGTKPGDPENLFSLPDPEFKRFKDSAERLLDQNPNSPIDVYLDPEIGELVVENLTTGKRLGYLDESKPVKQQLEQFTLKASD